MGNKPSLEDHLVNLRLTSKQMVRGSKKCESSEKDARNKLKKAIQSRNLEGARIYAQNAIREKTQALNYLRLSSRIDAVAARLESAIRMKQVTGAMAGIVAGMDTALKDMDVEKLAKVMDQFEKQFEDTDVRTGYLEGAIASTTASATPQEMVDSLIQETADAHNLELGTMLDNAGMVSDNLPAVEAQATNNLEQRFEALRK
ncbi:snf7 family protein [Nannochloropsis gaditana]|uniref:Snf7 family protein n=1 Tax=Nannochloropsis gaditana TaxID=72520 RepID=W7U1R3_9STRA|nr:snf7 family protein [Nannochloropsis gaditana]